MRIPTAGLLLATSTVAHALLVRHPTQEPHAWLQPRRRASVAFPAVVAPRKELKVPARHVVRLSTMKDDSESPVQPQSPSTLRRIANILGWFIEVPTEEPWAGECEYRILHPLNTDFSLLLSDLSLTHLSPLDWADPRIHSFGNMGGWGAVHAGIAPFFTWVLDMAAYEGSNLRERAAADLSLLRGERELPTRRIADLGCGTGPTARAMAAAFPGAEVIVGVDTSVEMLGVAKVLSAEQQASAEAKAEAATTSVSVGASRAPHLRLSAAGDVGDGMFFDIGDADNYWTGSSRRDDNKHNNNKNNWHQRDENSESIRYILANAEDTGLEKGSFDVVCAAFLLHEAPAKGRTAIIAEARRLLAPGGTFLVLDIARGYEPSPVMKSGEPYIEGYLKHIEADITGAGFAEVSCVQPVQGRAEQWFAHEALRKATTSSTTTNAEAAGKLTKAVSPSKVIDKDQGPTASTEN